MMLICDSRLQPLLPIYGDKPNQVSSQEWIDGQMRKSVHVLIIQIILILRISSSLTYILIPKLRSNFHYCANKIFQFVSLFIFSISALCLQSCSLAQSLVVVTLYMTVVVELLADYVYIICKQQRVGYLDSRLFYKHYLIRIPATYLCYIMLAFVHTPVNTDSLDSIDSSGRKQQIIAI